MNKEFLQEIERVTGADNVTCNEQMKNHTTFRVGGAADYFAAPADERGLINTIEICRKYNQEFYIVGNGSNLLVGDGGYRGMIIHTPRNFKEIQVTGNRVLAQAGALLSRVAKAAFEYSLTGLEFAAGIPGSVGGAAVMNAGAYGSEMKNVIRRVKILDADNQVLWLDNEELKLGYRTSVIGKEGHIVLAVELELEASDKQSIAGKMDELKEKRTSRQPLEYPSAGSTFKRPEGYFAGKLIMDAGLAGHQVGGAKVSEKHCGFVINAGNATAADVQQLILDVQKRVQDTFGVKLEPEVRLLGEFT